MYTSYLYFLNREVSVFFRHFRRPLLIHDCTDFAFFFTHFSGTNLSIDFNSVSWNRLKEVSQSLPSERSAQFIESRSFCIFSIFFLVSDLFVRNCSALASTEIPSIQVRHGRWSLESSIIIQLCDES